LSVEKLRRIEDALDTIRRNSVPGALVEFGVALGGSAIVIAKIAGAGRQFHGFDVFAMIPPPVSVNDDQKSRERYEVIRSGRSKGIDGGSDYYGYRENLFEDVKANFNRHGVPVDQNSIWLHRGLFEETWPVTNVGQVAFAHVDCDWYDPVSYCLNVLADRVSPGGVIMLDDYNDYGGARKATDEFVSQHSEFQFLPGANPMLVRRRHPA